MTYPLSLSTERLILREFTEDDWEATLTYQSDPHYLRYYPWANRTEAEVRDFIGLFLAQQAEQPRRKFQFAMTLKADRRLIGNCGVRVLDWEGGQADLGYELDPRFWGGGLATEAAQEMLRFGFENLKMHRLSGDCVAENIASRRVLEKVGMRQEACLHKNVWFKDRWWNSCVYGILRDEWPAPDRQVP